MQRISQVRRRPSKCPTSESKLKCKRNLVPLPQKTVPAQVTPRVGSEAGRLVELELSRLIASPLSQPLRLG